MTPNESRALHWLGGVLDAAGSHSWIHRTARPDVAALRLVLIHRDPAFLALVRGAARCGTIAARQEGQSWQWSVEGDKALALAGELLPHMHAPFPRSEDEARPGPALPDPSEPDPLPAEATLLPRDVGEQLRVTRAYVTRLAERHKIGIRRGDLRRGGWRFTPADVERLRAHIGRQEAPDA